MPKIRQFLRISMRHLDLQSSTSYNWRKIADGQRDRLSESLGECIYTINTSNRKWPRGVSYDEMMESRHDLIKAVTLP